MTETWDLWYPGAGATGLSFARTRVDGADAADRVLVHAAPPQLDLTVRDGDGAPVARGEGLERTGKGPISALLRDGDRITLEDLWPDESHLGLLVILPGGETGRLTSWWHAEDHSEWRWQIELYNSV